MPWSVTTAALAVLLPLVLLIAFCVLVAVLHKDADKSERATTVLKLLLTALTRLR